MGARVVMVAMVVIVLTPLITIAIGVPWWALASQLVVLAIAATFVLIPHRAGDANVRAVWLFSRNDAIGNAAVVVAAGLVAWTGTPWPDLFVATAVAGLFLQSSWSIIADAHRELRKMEPRR